MKNLKLFYLTFFLAVLFLTGCSNKIKSNDFTEIEFWTLQLSDFENYIESKISQYEKSNPNVRIKWVDVPFSEGEKRALAAVMSKNVPDVINLNPKFAATLAYKGALVNINDYITQEESEKYLKQTLKASSVDDFIYGIPWYVTSAITIYNTDIFKKADLNFENPPKTYEDLEKIAPLIKQKTGKYVLMPSLTENGQMLKIFNKYEIPIVSKDRKTALFNTTKAKEVLDLWVRLYSKNLIPKESLTQGHRASLEKYLAGETAVIVSGANFLKIIKENAPTIFKNSAVTTQMTGDSNKVDFSLMNLVIPKKSKHHKIALDFALFLTNPENQLEFCKLAPVLPSTKDSLNSPFFDNQNSTDIIKKGRSISASQLKKAISPLPILPDNKDLTDIIDNMTQGVLLEKTTPQKALDEATGDWNRVLNQ